MTDLMEKSLQDMDDAPSVSEEQFSARMRQRDTWLFFVGVMNVCWTTYFLGGHQWVMPFFYTAKYPLLLALRYFDYKTKLQHFFMMDFCYFGNLLFLFYLWVKPQSGALFAVAFSICNGPLAWSVLVFRNSLVFHSLDKITTVFIHITPPLVTFCLRWYHDDRTLSQWTVCPDGGNAASDSCRTNVIYSIAYPMLFFLCQQIFNMVFITGSREFQGNPRLTNSYRHLLRVRAVRSVVFALGDKYHKVVFVLLYTLASSISLLPTMLLFHSFRLHFAFLMVVLSVAVHRGGSFYVEVFSRAYQFALPPKKKK